MAEWRLLTTAVRSGSLAAFASEMDGSLSSLPSLRRNATCDGQCQRRHRRSETAARTTVPSDPIPPSWSPLHQCGPRRTRAKSLIFRSVTVAVMQRVQAVRQGLYTSNNGKGLLEVAKKPSAALNDVPSFGLRKIARERKVRSTSYLLRPIRGSWGHRTFSSLYVLPAFRWLYTKLVLSAFG